MAVTIPETEAADALVWPTLDDTALDRVRVDDVSTIDYLYVFLTGTPPHAVWDPRAEPGVWVGLLMDGEDDWTDEVVAIMVANFCHSALRRHPGWKRVVTETGQSRRAALRELIADVAAMPASGEANAVEAVH
jgi:hypothetical protein